MTYVVPGVPISKPRMTQRDKWASRPSVLKYWDWKAKVQKVCAVREIHELHATFYLPVPKTARKTLQAIRQYGRQGHHVKPDLDNLCKGLIDAIAHNDQAIAAITAWKFYDDGKGPRVEFSIW